MLNGTDIDMNEDIEFPDISSIASLANVSIDINTIDDDASKVPDAAPITPPPIVAATTTTTTTTTTSTTTTTQQTTSYKNWDWRKSKSVIFYNSFLIIE